MFTCSRRCVRSGVRKGQGTNGGESREDGGKVTYGGKHKGEKRGEGRERGKERREDLEEKEEELWIAQNESKSR